MRGVGGKGVEGADSGGLHRTESFDVICKD